MAITATCAWSPCGKTFTVKPSGHSPTGRTIYCSKSCSVKATNHARYEGKPRANGAGRKAATRRRRMVVATTWDGVTDEQILERDRWMCWICKRRIGKTFKFPHPRSASIDHLIPLALGGDDTAFNKKAAHLVCNMKRQTGRAGEHPMLNFSLDPNVEIRPRVKRKPTHKPRPPKPCKTCGELLVDGKCDLHQPVHILECVRCRTPVVSQKRLKRKACMACKTRPCAVPRCEEPVFFAAGDWCAAHHHRHQKYGDVLADIPVATNRAERIDVAALIDPTRTWHAARSIAKPAKTGTCRLCELYPLNTCCGQAS